MYAELGIDNTGLVTLKGLKDLVTGEYLNSGVTVEMTLYDSARNEVAGQTWPYVLVYVPDSDGVYAGVIRKEAQRIRGQTYTLEVAVTDGSDGATFTKEIRSIEREDF